MGSLNCLCSDHILSILEPDIQALMLPGDPTHHTVLSSMYLLRKLSKEIKMALCNLFNKILLKSSEDWWIFFEVRRGKEGKELGRD